MNDLQDKRLMSKSLDEKQIRKIIEEELEKRRGKEPITREEFLKMLELMNQRFKESDERFRELIDTMNQRFDESDKRFRELIDTMNQRYDRVENGHLLLKVAIDSLGRRSGIGLEKAILKLLQKVLENRDIDVNKIKWIELFDEEGEVFTKNYRTDVDILIRDGLHFLMEIKYKADNRDVYHFLKVAELYSRKHRKPNKLLLLTLEIDPKTQEYAETENIEVITGEF